MNTVNVVVIPGLSDNLAIMRVSWFLKKFLGKNRNVFVFNPDWQSSETAKEKFERLLVSFDELSPKNTKTVVVAYSAGGALATQLFSKNPLISKLILISGKLKGSTTIKSKYVVRAPSIIPLVEASESAINTISTASWLKTTCYVPLLDGVVPKRDMYFGQGKKKTIPFFGHALSIGFALVFLLKREFKI